MEALDLEQHEMQYKFYIYVAGYKVKASKLADFFHDRSMNPCLCYDHGSANPARDFPDDILDCCATHLKTSLSDMPEDLYIPVVSHEYNRSTVVAIFCTRCTSHD